jgi:hypothetical protein
VLSIEGGIKADTTDTDFWDRSICVALRCVLCWFCIRIVVIIVIFDWEVDSVLCEDVWICAFVVFLFL